MRIRKKKKYLLVFVFTRSKISRKNDNILDKAHFLCAKGQQETAIQDQM